METAFLSQIVEMGSQEALVKALKEAADPEDVERITKDNADSMVLLGKNLPSDVRKLKTGKCLIISQEKYEENYSDRDGTQEDVSFLTKTFETFGCKSRVTVERNVPDGEGLKNVIRKFKDGLGNQKLDFVVVCILAHGNDILILYTEAPLVWVPRNPSIFDQRVPELINFEPWKP